MTETGGVGFGDGSQIGILDICFRSPQDITPSDPQSMRPSLILFKISTTQLGTAYENHCLQLLSRQLCMSLTRVGGRGDGGVDLRGWWWLPTNKEGGRRRLRVLGQCKAESIKCGPRLIREMEGVGRRGIDHAREPDLEREQEQEPVGGGEGTEKDERTSILTIICSKSGFSPAALLDAKRSRIPMLLLQIPFEQPMLHTRSSSTVSLPNISEEDSEIEDELELVENTLDDEHHVTGSYWNPALVGPRGVLDDHYEIRKEHLQLPLGSSTPTGVFGAKKRAKQTEEVLPYRIGLYWNGSPLDQSYSPVS